MTERVGQVISGNQALPKAAGVGAQGVVDGHAVPEGR